MSKALGTFRAMYVVALCCTGSFPFAYDAGIIGGILTFDNFQNDFGHTPAQNATVGSNSTSLLQAGVAKVGRREESLKSSVWVRGDDSTEVQQE
ncbi:hypothetical protein HD806DRAFT_536978 [Xylariaceae sp. AK1471]|nr:hypothetical protein HD806DRAFT_536978 [Xylariaceae sp. AK1471]